MYSSRMTDSTASPAPTPRKPSGAAVAGAHPRPKKYPRQLVIMADDKLADYIDAEAEAAGESKSEVARRFLIAGIDALQNQDRL